jgi:hypothetical protein
MAKGSERSPSFFIAMRCYYSIACVTPDSTKNLRITQTIQVVARKKLCLVKCCRRYSSGKANSYTTPWAIIASATFTNPPMLAPSS